MEILLIINIKIGQERNVLYLHLSFVNTHDFFLKVRNQFLGNDEFAEEIHAKNTIFGL